MDDKRHDIKYTNLYK